MSQDSLNKNLIASLKELITQSDNKPETLDLVREILKRSALKAEIQNDPEFCFNILRYLIAQDNSDDLNEMKFLFENFNDLMGRIIKCDDQALMYKLMRTAAFIEALNNNRLTTAIALHKRKKTIAITLPKPPQGYGDMLFALKLAYQLREKLYKEHGYTGDVFFITDSETAKTIRELNGHHEFSLDVMSIEEIRKNREDKGMQLSLDLIIHGAYIPSLKLWQPDFLDELALALYGKKKIDGMRKARLTSRKQIDVLFAPEYNATGGSQRNPLELKERIDLANQNVSDTTRYFDFYRVMDIVWSGFASEDVNEASAQRKEHGIIVSAELLDGDENSKKKHLSNLPSDMTKSLFGCSPKDAAANWGAYQQRSELCFAYSYDYYNKHYPQTNASIHFLQVHREYVRDHNKNQDVILIGGDKDDKDAAKRKKEALLAVKNKLIADGYTKIEFVDTTTSLSLSEVLFQHPDKTLQPKTYRVIYQRRVSHATIIALNAVSSAISGATGDQSLGEALSALKIVVYECIGHKKMLQQHMISVLKSFTDDENVKELIDLLFFEFYGQYHTTDYERLGELIRDPKVFAEMQRITKKLCTERNLVSHFATLTSERLKQMEGSVVGSEKPYAIACVMNEIENHIKIMGGRPAKQGRLAFSQRKKQKKQQRQMNLLSEIFARLDEQLKQNGSVSLLQLQNIVSQAKNIDKKNPKKKLELSSESQALIDKLKHAINAEDFLAQEELEGLLRIISSDDVKNLDSLLAYSPWLRNMRLRKAISQSMDTLTKIYPSHLVWFAQHSPEFFQYIIQQAEHDAALREQLAKSLVMKDSADIKNGFRHIVNNNGMLLTEIFSLAERDDNILNCLLDAILSMDADSVQKIFLYLDKSYFISVIQRTTNYRQSAKQIIGRLLLPEILAENKITTLVRKNHGFLANIRELIISKKLNKLDACNLEPEERVNLESKTIRQYILGHHLSIREAISLTAEQREILELPVVLRFLENGRLKINYVKKLTKEEGQRLEKAEELILAEKITLSAALILGQTQLYIISEPSIRKLVIDDKITLHQCMWELKEIDRWNIVRVSALIAAEKMTFKQAKRLTSEQIYTLGSFAIQELILHGCVTVDTVKNLSREEREKFERTKGLLISEKITVETVNDLSREQCWKLFVVSELINAEKITVSEALHLSDGKILSLRSQGVRQAVLNGVLSIDETENMPFFKMEILESDLIHRLVNNEDIAFTWKNALSLEEKLFRFLDLGQVYKQLAANTLSFDVIKGVFDKLPANKKYRIYVFQSKPIRDLVAADGIPLNWQQVFDLNETLLVFLKDKKINSQLLNGEQTVDKISQRVNKLLADSKKGHCLTQLLDDGTIYRNLDLGGERSVEDIERLLNDNEKLEPLAKILSKEIITTQQLQGWGRPNLDKVLDIVADAKKLRLLKIILADDAITSELSNGELSIGSVLGLLYIDKDREELESRGVNIETLRVLLKSHDDLSGSYDSYGSYGSSGSFAP